MNIIEIEGLTYTYPGAETPILDHVNLQVEKGDFLAIVGNNGCGKSTLCKTLNGLIPHFITGEFSGRVLVDGVNTLEADVGALAKKAGSFSLCDFSAPSALPARRHSPPGAWSRPPAAPADWRRPVTFPKRKKPPSPGSSSPL